MSGQVACRLLQRSGNHGVPRAAGKFIRASSSMVALRFSPIAHSLQPGFFRKRRAFRRVARSQGVSNFARLGFLDIAAAPICCDAFSFSSSMRRYSPAEQLPVAINHQRRASVSLDAKAIRASINGPAAAFRLAIAFLPSPAQSRRNMLREELEQRRQLAEVPKSGDRRTRHTLIFSSSTTR